MGPQGRGQLRAVDPGCADDLEGSVGAAADRHGLSLESAPSVDAWFDRYACDLWAWVKRRFVSPDGYSLKVIAPLCGFGWRDGDAGGAQSELWYADQLGGSTDQRQRLLDYNEDDVRAQAAIRCWISRPSKDTPRI